MECHQKELDMAFYQIDRKIFQQELVNGIIIVSLFSIYPFILLTKGIIPRAIFLFCLLMGVFLQLSWNRFFKNKKTKLKVNCRNHYNKLRNREKNNR